GKVLPLDEAEPPQLVEARGVLRRLTRRAGQDGDAIGSPHLLGACRKRPRRRAAESQDELAPLHSITSSARASNVAGISTPIVLAVCRLMTSSNLVACIIGKSAAFSPLRMRPA